MRILVDITHPAHVHFFKNAISLWKDRGHDVFLTARRKDIAVDLLNRYGYQYEDLGPARSGLLGLSTELLIRNYKLSRVVNRLRPDVMTGISGVFISHVGALKKIPTVIFTDTENANLANLISFPFATLISTPRCYEGKVPSSKHRPYAGYHELAYTHPNRFSPDPSVLEKFGLSEGESFIVMRIVSWGASHDVLDHGFNNIPEVVTQLKKFGRVLISSEKSLPAELEHLRISANPELVHHLLYYARLFIGESATMASESATLGTPAIFISTSVRGYTNEQESRFGATFTFSDPKTAQQQGAEKALEILGDSDSKRKWREKRERMLSETIDVTQHIADLVEACGNGQSNY